MKRYFILLAALFVTATAFGQDTLYIYLTSEDATIRQNMLVLKALFQEQLRYHSDFKILGISLGDKSSAALVREIDLYKNGTSYDVDPAQKKDFGKLLTAQKLCNIEVKLLPSGDYFFYAEIFDVEKGESPASVHYPLEHHYPVKDILDLDNMNRVARIMVEELMTQLKLQKEDLDGDVYLDENAYPDTDACLDLSDASQVKSEGGYGKTPSEQDKYNKKLKLRANLKAAGASLVVPGLGLVLKGHNEGYAYLGAEAALCLGGIMVPELMRKNYIHKMNKESNGHNQDVYESRANTCRKVSIISGTCAGLLHVANIVHSYLAKSEYGAKIHWQLTALPVQGANRNDYALGMALTYRF